MRKNTGFTLLELMVVMAITAILSVIVVPNMIVWRNNAKFNGGVLNLRGDLEMAKLRAIKENAKVAVIFDVVDNGYTIFVDNGAGANANNWTHDENEQLLRNIQLPAGIKLSTTRSKNRLRFNSRGRCTGITIISANTNGKKMDVIVSSVGRIRISSIYE